MASVNCNYLSFWVVTVIATWLHRCDSINGSSTEQCSFPGFLQDDCTNTATMVVCRQWSQGRRVVVKGERNDFFNRRGEYTWTFHGGEVKISSSSLILVFTCWRKIGPHKFIISSRMQGSNSSAYSCVSFRKRGLNVIEYEQSAWQDNPLDLLCDTANLTVNESPLISNMAQELVECPRELKGGLRIVQIHDVETGKVCHSNKEDNLGSFESDCVGKEGLFIDLKAQTNCSISRQHAVQLSLYCYSESWKERNTTYFIAKIRRTRTENVFTNSDLVCIGFQQMQENKKEFQVQIHKEPICWRNLSGIANVLTLSLTEKNANEIELFMVNITTPECRFPIGFQGTWKEISLQNGHQNIVITNTMIDIAPYGHFHCKQQYVFQHQAPYRCSSLATEKWPGIGRVKFFMDDFLLVSNFTNGCRPRFTRLGLTRLIGSDVMVYRLSQSEPMVEDGRTPEQYYKLEVLNRFCSSWLPYIRDPYPIWGRNIEKVIVKYPATNQKHPCPLPTLGEGIYSFQSVYADHNCTGALSRVQFTCINPSRFDVTYDSSCGRASASFNCLGRAWKFGEFSLVQDVKSMNISCVWFDRNNRQLYRLNSPQCSDVDWGILPGKKESYFEKLIYKYYSKCPIDPETTNDYPVVIGRRNNSCCLHNAWGITALLWLFIAVLC